ncbi:NACHT domain-containing protein [Pseudomonas sp. MAP12]|uniref:NACHT domain-containing protein n=1 Tax=Geopseudomonas aromaticivorans TaxID=2849492 RepID=A0ABS6MUZ3_9GAMM|nr:NACHT domain-containing protein [Pseudomonas aromaticivorans]MBV2132077.1 NACHT domain-containing protein [Pseudomonas aromaticivorans]
MDEGKIAAEFISSNLDKIWQLGKRAFGSIDETVQIKLKTAYSEYLQNTREKYSKSKSFFIRNQAVDLYDYYIPTGIYSGTQSIPIPKFNSCLDYSNRIVITGTGGSGKSVLMRHLFLDCMSQKKYVPILIELRDLNSGKSSLEDYIVETLDLYGFDVSGSYVEKAKKEGHFCFFLDGYDEVDHSLRKNLIKQILKSSEKFKNCPIFISSRPDDVFNGIERFSVFRMQPLDLESASNLISKLPFDQEIKYKFIGALSDGLFEKHESFLSNPLLLSIMLLTYGENAEIPSKLSIFYNQAYEALFQRHDANKGGYSRSRKSELDIQDFSRVFSLFALQTYDRRIFKMPRVDCLQFIEKAKASLKKEFKSDDYLSDLLSAACLLIEDGLEIAFSHRSFQEYFVALHISCASPEIQERLINRYWKNMTSDNVINLLLEINPDLVERVLITPKLKDLFSEIGVRDKVGITHAVKYMQRAYESITLDEEKIYATYPGTEANICAIIHMAVYICETYSFPEDDYFEDNHRWLLERHGSKDGEIKLKTESVTYKTPLMADILNSRGAFSIGYLQAAYDAYKILKRKNESAIDSLGKV